MGCICKAHDGEARCHAIIGGHGEFTLCGKPAVFLYRPYGKRRSLDQTALCLDHLDPADRPLGYMAWNKPKGA